MSRNVESASGDLAATTGAAGDAVLQLANVHGDVMLALPLTAGGDIVALDSDEYGNPRAGQSPVRYGWLGGKQRSAETPTGLTLMGVRLYNPVTGRFLSVDPVYGGGDNRYGYPADPVNQFDLDGKWWKPRISPAVRLGWYYLKRGHSRVRGQWNRQQASMLGVTTAYVGTRYLGYRCRYSYGMRVCSGSRGLHSRGGTTLGTTFFTSSRVTPRLMKHERRHKKQWQRYGLRFGYMYFRAGVNPCRNKWERRAGWADGGYSC
ncbi:RHS repeat-associated core domain-containing protein [Streptomyces sp. NPDC032161]|uniref:RHS repeat-associated core domain-containing protein n=1 Tax=unclassified Streptomyces TaxID=2593676 RepID=UPI0033E3E039